MEPGGRKDHSPGSVDRELRASTVTLIGAELLGPIRRHRVSDAVQKYPRSGGPRCRNAPYKAAFGAEIRAVLGVWGRLWGTFLACGEGHAAYTATAERA